jgi:hypothetical protein
MAGRMASMEEGLPRFVREHAEAKKATTQVTCYAGGFTCGLLLIVVLSFVANYRTLQPNEQIVVTVNAGKYTIDGTGAGSQGQTKALLAPWNNAEYREAKLLSAKQYARVTDKMSGKKRIVSGPVLLFLGAYEKVEFISDKLVLQETEYVRLVDELTGAQRVASGKQTLVPGPSDTAPDGVLLARTLARDEFVRITESTTGKKRIVAGEALVVPQPYEVLGATEQAPKLTKTQYVTVRDETTGVLRTVIGPLVFFPGAYETVSEVQEGMKLARTQYVVLQDKLTGQKLVERGEQLLFLDPNHVVVQGVSEALKLTKTQMVRIRDETTGHLRVVTGDTVLFPGAYDTVHDVEEGIQLTRNDWVRIKDVTTGAVRVEVGEQLVFPSAAERVVDRAEAYKVTPSAAALVQSTQDGQLRLVTKEGLFVPGPYEQVLEMREICRVEPHEAVVVVDNMGRYTFYDGSKPTGNSTEPGAAFFLPPHSEKVTMQWTALDGAAKEAVTEIDMRSQYMPFSYVVRTLDNVQMQISGTLFWQVTDVPVMVAATPDPRGDISRHARNVLIGAISQTTLAAFMETFNPVIQRAFIEDKRTDFYSKRGIQLHSMEVTGYECLDEETALVLQQIIQAKTNKILDKEKQDSENEVARAKLLAENELEKSRLAATLELEQQRIAGEAAQKTQAAASQAILATQEQTAALDLEQVTQQHKAQIALDEAENALALEKKRLAADIEVEAQTRELLQLKLNNSELSVALTAGVTGEAEGRRMAEQAAHFMDVLEPHLPNATDRFALYQRQLDHANKAETTRNLAAGQAKLFLTPEKLDLRLGPSEL